MGLIHFGDKDHFCDTSQKRFDEDAIRTFCARRGLAFYDTACEVRRLKDNASDAFLEVVTLTNLKELLCKIPDCKSIIATGQKATEIIAGQFGCGIPSIRDYTEIGIDEDKRLILFWRMPSTSRAYPLPLEKKADYYRRLFEK